MIFLAAYLLTGCIFMLLWALIGVGRHREREARDRARGDVGDGVRHGRINYNDTGAE